MTDTLTRELAKERARNIKADQAADMILHAYATEGLPAPSPDAIDGLTEDGWAALEQLVGRVRYGDDRIVRFRSPETREKVPAAYRRKVKYQARLAAMTIKELCDV